MKKLLCFAIGFSVLVGCSSNRIIPMSGGNIEILSGTYGGNCGAPKGNVTRHIASLCNGHNSCAYTVHHETIGDPAFGCEKTYTATYKCSGTGQVKTVFVNAEAGYGSIAHLNCN